MEVIRKIKVSQKTPVNEIKLAERMKNDYMTSSPGGQGL